MKNKSISKEAISLALKSFQLWSELDNRGLRSIVGNLCSPERNRLQKGRNSFTNEQAKTIVRKMLTATDRIMTA